MRLLLVAKSAWSGSGPDGREYPAILSGMTVGFVRGLVRTSLAQGHELTYVFPATVGPSEVTFVDAADPLPDGVVSRPFWDGPIAKSAISAASVELLAIVADACARPETRPDVAVFVYPFPLLSVAAPVLRAAGVPYVATFRGGDAYRWLPEPAVGPDVSPNQSLVRDAYREHLRACASTTAASEWLADVAREAGVTVDAIVGSPPPSDGVAPEVTADRSRWKQEYLADGYVPVGGEPLRADRLWLLWSGRLSKDKRPDLAIESFNRAATTHDRWQLVIAGEGDRSLLPENLPPGVGHVFVPPRSLPRMLRAADAALHTAVPGSFIDSRPSSVLQASSYGLPCITVRAEGVGGTDECISPEVLRRLGVPGQADEDAIVRGIAASVDQLTDDATRVALSADVAGWANETGLWSQMDRFLEVTARSIGVT
ncbi:MAG TPA: glycosyltransferase family 4 protein [Acidimicrobiales bacterium]|nr:glycosyltransferase family 4 protein [Acidimicrobiales bacterium]